MAREALPTPLLPPQPPRRKCPHLSFQPFPYRYGPMAAQQQQLWFEGQVRPSAAGARDGGQISLEVGRGGWPRATLSRGDSLILSLKDYELSTWQARQEGDRCGLCPPELAGWWGRQVLKRRSHVIASTGGSQCQRGPLRKGCQEVAPLNFQSEGKEKKRYSQQRDTQVPRLEAS